MKWTAVGLIVVLVFAAVAAGCIGGGGEKTSTSGAPPTTTSGGQTTKSTSSSSSSTGTYSGTITIYTGGTSGVYFPLGSKYAEILNKNGVSAKAVTSGASVTNAKAIGEGKAQAVILQNDVAYYAYKGIYMFDGKAVKKLRGVAALYPETVQFVVRANSDIKSLQDLKGKRVAIGAPGSGTAVAAEQILKAAGVWDSIDKINQKFSEAAQSLKLGQIDAAVIVSGAPTPAVNQIAVQTPVRVLPIPDDILAKLKDQGYIFYVRQVLPKDTYNGMKEDTPTVAVKAMLAVSADLPDDLVYKMTKILFDNLDELHKVHAKTKYISLDTALDGMSIPLHPGAIKYYEEKGITVPDNLKP
ncbi:C4-dicarboxylate ABC transporter substrate-binding protein [Thermococcus profundus]|uniref:C4-dicarboxylate ABC transporter substrate-binding protein n=1 Tax=Thermococcus profundus TaxID=49899 RepID=A0A2Z2MB74_THEPR|nr:TAXI family TRAP transporter solute-binding subunit [Thermococcus profundus]ASJ01852.1 C4-dicarboxylate ABC transporter substrate-binding protein [Thermococcus profundus]